MRRPISSRRCLLVGAIVLGACSSSGSDSTSTEPNPTVAIAEDSVVTTEPVSTIVALVEREGPRRETTGDVPHIQIGAVPDAALDAELRRRVFQLPRIDDRPSDRSLPGARGLAFGREAQLARPDVIEGSNEFAHIHPDGSLHVWLPVDRAVEVDRTLWGELHPWVDREGFWDGVVMIYTPETDEDLETTIRLVVDAYNFITGAKLGPEDIP